MRARRSLVAIGLLTALMGGAACGNKESPKAAIKDDAPTLPGVDSGTDEVPSTPVPSPSPTGPPAPTIVFPQVQAAIGQQMGTIEIPKIGLVHKIFQGFELKQIDNGPGHWPKSPVPGQVGNVVFAGHRVTHSKPFFDIDKLAVGDQIIFKMPWGQFVYEMTGQSIVAPTDVHILNPTNDATITLFACHPKHSAAKRYVITGKLVSATPPAAV